MELEQCLAKNLKPIKGDFNQLQEVFVNLLMNAYQAMPDGGKITVETRGLNDDFVEIRIRDTGPGIAPENLNRIFQPLFSTKVKGIGFGLSIAKMVIDKHGGTIAAKSEPGKGAIIVIQLPLYKDESKEA